MNRLLTLAVAATLALSATLASPAQATPATSAGWSAPTSSPDRSLVEQRRSLLRLLGAHEFTPDLEAFERVGPDIRELLVEIAGAPSYRATVRGRAVASLRLYPTHDTRKFLEGLLWERSLKGTPAGTLIRREAIQALGRAYGEGVVDVIAALREDGDPQIREAVAHGLGATLSPRAARILEAWLPNEQELFVRLAVDRALNELIRRGRAR